MCYFDAHNHGHLISVGSNIEALGMICCSADPADWPSLLGFVQKASCAYAAYGIHPWASGKWNVSSLHALRCYIASDPGAGIGEIGLDFSRKDLDRQQQVDSFTAQLQLGVAMRRFVCVHCVRAWGALSECLQSVDMRGARIMIHDFRGSAEVARELTQAGVYLSINAGNYREKHREMISCIPDAFLLMETDAGGKKDDIFPTVSLLQQHAEMLAGWRGQDVALLSRMIFENSLRFISMQ